MGYARLGAEGVGGPTGGRLEQELKASLVDGKLPCAVAFQIAAKLKVSRRQVGEAANALRVRVVDCQLGCFQVRKATHEDIRGIKVAEALAQKVQAAAADGFLPCPAAFKVAGKLKVAPKDVGDAATALKIRIVRCQLGCF